MSTQYRDGSWREVEPINEALKTLKKAINDGSAKAFVVGTPEEISKAQDESKVEKELKAIQDRLLMLEAEEGVGLIVLPTREEKYEILTDR